MLPASMRLCMGSRRGFIVRMKIGNTAVDPMTASHTIRIRQRNTLGPSSDGHQYAVVHVTGYVKNWPPAGRNSTSFKAGTVGENISEFYLENCREKIVQTICEVDNFANDNY